jgi:hypothetical protein
LSAQVDFEKAVDRVIGGLEKGTQILTPHEKRIVAVHESGHAVAGWFLEHADPLLKVTIVPRSKGALGFAQYLPKELHLYQTEQLLDRMCVTLAGKAAEQTFFSKVSTGASDDLKRVTEIAYAAVSVYGMNPRVRGYRSKRLQQPSAERSAARSTPAFCFACWCVLCSASALDSVSRSLSRPLVPRSCLLALRFPLQLGNVSYQPEKDYQKPYSEATGQIIDEEVSKLIASQYQRTLALIAEKKHLIERLAERLEKVRRAATRCGVTLRLAATRCCPFLVLRFCFLGPYLIWRTHACVRACAFRGVVFTSRLCSWDLPCVVQLETINHDVLVEVLGPRPFSNDVYRDFLSSEQSHRAKAASANGGSEQQQQQGAAPDAGEKKEQSQDKQA